MSTFEEIGKLLSEKIRTSARSVLFEEGKTILEELRSRSPRDKGIYRAGWFMTQPRFVAGNVLASVGFRNNIDYGTFLEYGAEIGKAPWYFTGKKKRKTGKLTIANGLVWAGGLIPGHSETIGGAIDPVIYNNDAKQLDLAKKIANGIIDSLR